MKVTLLTRDLDAGGAERQVVTLAKALHARGTPTSVVSCFAGGALERELRDAGVPVHVLDKRGRWDVFPFLARLIQRLRLERPDALCSYLVLPNILAAVAKPLLPGCRVAWGLRASDMDLSRYDRLSRLTPRVERLLAFAPDVVICNSAAGRRQAELRGFPTSRLVVVPNGIDAARFAPDEAGARRVRAEWGVPDAAPLVGLVARLDPMKDHETFLSAAARLAAQRDDTRFACVGDGTPAAREAIARRAEALGLSAHLTWSASRDDMPAVYSALSLLVSSSAFGEGFSNAVAESMACGTPCVVTDVGDSKLIVGDEGVVVAPRDAEALAAGIAGLLARRAAEPALAARARERIVSEFGVESLVRRTLAALGL